MQSFAISALSRRISRKFSTNIFTRQSFKRDPELDNVETQNVRYKPEGLDSLCRNTNFTRKELQIMYRGFKQECPTGVVKEDTFKDIYAQFFPQGDSSTYAHYVFNVFDQDHDGTVSFEEFVTGLSVLARGTINEKLQWAFNLYDVNGDGIITRDEMLEIVTAIYDLMGKYAEPLITADTAREHVDGIFEAHIGLLQVAVRTSTSGLPTNQKIHFQLNMTKMDADQDGIITIDEFMEACRTDENIAKSMTMFDTVL